MRDPGGGFFQAQVAVQMARAEDAARRQEPLLDAAPAGGARTEAPAPPPSLALFKWLFCAGLVFLASAVVFLFLNISAVLLLPAFQFMVGPRARQPAWFVAACRRSRILAGIQAILALALLGGVGFLVCLSLLEDPDAQDGVPEPADSFAKALTVAVALPVCVGGKYVYSWWADRRERAREAEERLRRQRYIAKFPLRTLNATDLETAADSARGCPVCLEDFSLDDERRTLPCFHNFHKDCIQGWLDQHSLCPVCRHDITTGFDGQEYNVDHDSAAVAGSAQSWSTLQSA